jgi:uncharacterized protein YkwD
MGYRTLQFFLVVALFAVLSITNALADATVVDRREQFVLSEINRIRAEQGLPQLRLNDRLRALARSHSINMAESGYLSHVDSLGRDFRGRLGSKLTERSYAGENVATNNAPDSARAAIQGWCQSPKHLRNILNEKFTETGIGVATNADGLVFFTQIFLGK